MKPRILIATFPMLALVATLAGCGGGGDDEAGSLTAFSVQPSSLTLTAPTGSPAGACLAGFQTGGYAGDVYIYGGTAPYRLNNSMPDGVLLHASSTDSTPVSVVNDRGGSFSVTFINGWCLSPATVIVVDKLDKQVVLTLNNKPAS
jgi:hypothetical protein